MVDLYRSRRGHFYKCFYWKRDESGFQDNETLIHENRPSGVFYAKISANKVNDTQDVAGVFRVGVETIRIETDDIVALKKDDIVKFNGSDWLVGVVASTPIQSNAEFCVRESTRTFIELSKGI